MTSARSLLARSWNRLLVGAAAVSLVLAAAGCSSSSGGGSGSDGGGSKLSAAQQECVDKADAYLKDAGLLPDSLPKELTPLSRPPKSGLTITRLISGSIPSNVRLSDAVGKIAPEIGWTFKNVAYDGSVEDLNRKAMDAIANSDVVEVDAIPTAALQGPIAAAKARGVLFMVGAIAEPPVSVPGFGGVPFGGEEFISTLAERGAYTLMKETNCQAKVAVFGIPSPSQQAAAAFVNDTLKKQCEDCKYSYTNIPFADIGSPAATNAVISKLQSDPSINFLFFTLGDLATGVAPALKQAGIEVKVGGLLPNPENLKALKQGTDAFWVGIAVQASAYNLLDTAVRALDTGKPTVGNHMALSTFTSENIKDVEFTDQVPVYPTDIGEQFKKLWLVD